MNRSRFLLVAWLGLGLASALGGCSSYHGPSGRCTIVVPPPPRPRPTPEEVVDARRLFSRGVRLSERRRWGEALDAFRSAQHLVDHPVTSYNVAYALWLLGRYDDVVREVTHFNVIYDPVGDRAMYERAQRLMERARSRTGALVLTVVPGGASVRIDGVESARLDSAPRDFTLDPGPHTVDVSAPDRRAIRFTIRTRSGQRRARAVTLPAFRPQPAESERGARVGR